jgi:hypothetical protein
MVRDRVRPGGAGVFRAVQVALMTYTERYYRNLFAMLDARREHEPGYGSNAERLIVMAHIRYLDFELSEFYAEEQWRESVRNSQRYKDEL